MKKILFSYLLLFALITINANGQSKGVSKSSPNRCGTMTAFEEMMRDPRQRAIYEENQRIMIQNYANSRAASRTNATIDDTIPCVVHIILANASTVTDATCQSQMDVLTADYSGLNADSVNIPAAFKPLFGKIKLKFMLAQTDPNGLPTTGIERRNNNITFTQATYNNAKSYATGGMDNWDPCKYLNFWVVQFTDGLLGISVFPGTGTTAQQGFECDYRCFGTGASYLYAAFNKGRTATHEIGHYFNLRHINGDATCGNDFPGSPAGWDDTPLQAALTSGCPSGVKTDACSTTPPGIMYQNYMDYTDDACYCMFTVGQDKRVEQALTSAPDRSCLLNSLTYLPPVVYPNDAAVTAILTPLDGSLLCNGTITPKFTLRNSGSSVLSSVKVTVTVDGTPQTPVTLTPNLAANSSTDITLSALNLALGNHTIIIATSLPNNVADQSPANDSKTTSFSVISSIAAPLTESFEGATFPPTNWTLTQVSGSGNWTRVTTAAKTGTASAKFNNYSYAAGTASSLTTPPITFASTISTATLTFQYAHRTYSGENDKLEVFVSTDCGTTWTSVWARSGATGTNALVTVTGTQTSAFTPTAAQWTQSPISVDLSAYRTQAIQVKFTATSAFGNNLYIDDINIFGTNAITNDAGVTAIVSPVGQKCGSFTPSFTIKNYGTLPLTSVVLNYRLDGSTTTNSQTFTGLNIAPSASSTLTFTAAQSALTTGNHTIKAYTTLPNTVADLQNVNDTTGGAFTFFAVATLPVVEGFENTTFPPVGWTLSNPDNGITWARNTAAFKSGTASAKLDFYNYTTAGQMDYLISPSVNFAGNDSAFVTFHYAYKQYDAPSSDTLEVVISSDCGATWQSIWKKGGSELTTSTGFTTAAFTPTAAQWSQTPVKINLGAYINSGSIFVAFRGKNNYGNNLYLDNINIYGKILPNYDARVSEIVNPGSTICLLPTTPQVRVFNEGKIALTSVKVNYTINGGTPVTQTFTGLNVPLSKDTLLSLAPITSLNVGTNYTFKAFTSLPNNQADQDVSNDTSTVITMLLTPKSIPFTESFENSTFAATNWEIVNTNNDVTWERFTSPKIVASHLSAAAGIKNYRYTPTGRVDYLVSPLTKFTANDTAIIKFDVAAATYQYPGSTVISLDTLELQFSTDCGANWITIYKKWGDQLQTIHNPNNSYIDTFYVNNASQWRTDSVVLGTILANGGFARFRFKNTCFGGNNIFIDNINLYSKTLSPNVKQNGYTVSPNPASNVITIQHYLQPSKLRGVGFYNSAGQRVLYRSYNGNADSYLTFNVSGLAAGVYTVKLEYTNKTISEKVIKL